MNRIWAVLAIVTMTIYALGYAFAVIGRNAVWMLEARQVNIAAALFTVALLILTMTPVLDPAMVAVSSQVARLLDGRTPVNDFDFEYLRLQGGRYGNQRLQDLARNTAHEHAKLIRQKAADALKVTHRTFKLNGPEPLTREQLPCRQDLPGIDAGPERRRLAGKDMGALGAAKMQRELDALDFSAKPNAWSELWIGNMKYQVEEQ